MSTTAKEVRAIVERIERLHTERDNLASDIRDLYGEAKGKQLDVKALKAVIAYRRKDRTATEDLAARTAEYLAMVEVGTVDATRAGARSESRGGGESRRPAAITGEARVSSSLTDNVTCRQGRAEVAPGPRDQSEPTPATAETAAIGVAEPARSSADISAGSTIADPFEIPAMFDRRPGAVMS